MTDKIRVDMADLTLGEMAEAGELVGASLDQALSGATQPLAVAALAYVVQRRTNPDYTFEEAKALRISDIDMATGGDGDPEALAASNGGTPQPSQESGVSVPST